MASPPVEKRRRVMPDVDLPVKAEVASKAATAEVVIDTTPEHKLDDAHQFFEIDHDAQLILETDSEEDQEFDDEEPKFSPPTPETEVPSQDEEEEPEVSETESDSCSSSEAEEQQFENPALFLEWLDAPSAPSTRTQNLVRTCARARQLVKGENNLALLEDTKAYARAQYLASYFVHVRTSSLEEARDLRSDVALEALATASAMASVQAALGKKIDDSWKLPEESPIDFVESLTQKLLETLREEVSIPTEAFFEIYSEALRACAEAAMNVESALRRPAKSVAATAVALAACPWMAEHDVEVTSDQIYDALAYEIMSLSDLRRCTQDIADVYATWKRTRGLAKQPLSSLF
eukprot:CAMPEP_0206476736 /NCGR_PEP_ID=MMETSP0324_2-20121206/34907_1 /ASSEMBLY_ACC=CAM_ASM_000836 /TAXON_ID=2866 /ORGANISM="Crypthecodinium cohnii, Strain Seligo" /LENGTH=348 /DNA_ID=CAMNT_0053952451 /DNA_START=169 /DNA_END=1215 /DNA_ORIENTATION=+